MVSLSGIVWLSGSIQQFVFTPAIETGYIHSAEYGTEIGVPALQDFTYDYTKGVFAAHLLEDADGILPSGSGTCDFTPTIQWDASSVLVGPYLYSWTLYSEDTSGGFTIFVASGTTVNVNSAVMPVLIPGTYEIDIVSTGRTGGTTTIHPLVFEVRDCVFEQSPKVSIIDPFDIEPLIPVDDDYIRYYPQWMALHGTATAPPSASTTFQFFQLTLKNFRELDKEVVSIGNQLAVLDTPVNLPRKAWHLQSRFTSRDVITIDCIASGMITNVRRESSTFKFMSADDPVFIIGDNGHIAFRNLAQRVITVSPVNSSATGALSFLTTQYKIPFERSGMVPDANVLFFFEGLEYRIRAGSSGMDPYQSVIQLTTPFSGDIEFIYQSETLAPVVTVSISGNPAVSPSPIDLWNRFDELGIYCGIVRRKDEDNLIFRKRLYSRFISKPGISNKQTAAHIAQDLTLCDVITWDGITTIDLSGQDIWGVKVFEVGGLPQTDYITEQLVPAGSDYTTYSGSKSDWKAGHIVFLNGRVVTKAQYPNFIVSGNTVNFGVSVSGVVTASYEYDNYTLATTPLHTILTVSPAGSNPLSGSYTVMLAKNVMLHTVADPTYQRTNLLRSNGTPNDYFYNIANQLTRDNPLAFGRARWKSGVWSEQNEQQPLTFSLPLPLDIFTTY